MVFSGLFTIRIELGYKWGWHLLGPLKPSVSIFYVLLVITKEKYTFTMENSGGHHLNEMFKLSHINRDNLTLCAFW